MNVRLEIELPGVLRWLGRRVHTVHTTLVILKGLLPNHFASVAPTLAAFGQTLGTDTVLVLLREMAADFLPTLPPPLGFRPPLPCANRANNDSQHRAGPDPPTQLL